MSYHGGQGMDWSEKRYYAPFRVEINAERGSTYVMLTVSPDQAVLSIDKFAPC